MLGDFMLEAPGTESTNSLRGILGYRSLGYVKHQLTLKRATDLDGQCCSLPACAVLNHSFIPHLRQRKGSDFGFVALFDLFITYTYSLGSHWVGCSVLPTSKAHKGFEDTPTSSYTFRIGFLVWRA